MRPDDSGPMLPAMARRPILDGMTDRVEIRCSPEQRAAWESAAKEDRGRRLADWIRWQLDQAAGAEKTPRRRTRQS